jgi:hypothetical protein
VIANGVQIMLSQDRTDFAVRDKALAWGVFVSAILSAAFVVVIIISV